MSETTILIVEDEAIVAADLAGKLGQLGYKVVGTAAGGGEAIALAGRVHPHLVLMDISLEGSTDGIEAAEAIRREHDVPVIFLTAHSDSGTLARAKLTEPFGYILKPFEERELATCIEMALYKHQTDRQLRQQREWLRVTLTSIGDAVIATDDEGRITFLNPVAELLTGWHSAEAVGQPIECVFRVFNEQTGLPLEEPVARVLRERRAVELANHAALLTKDGRSVPVEDSAAPILDAAGQLIGVVLVFHDVTQKRRAEESVRESQARFRNVFDHAATGIAITDCAGRLVQCNAAYCRLTGYTQAELNASEFPALIHPEDREHNMGFIRQLLAGEFPSFEIENRYVHKDGSVAWVGKHVSLLRDDRGQPTHIVALVTDRTERKQAEDVLRFLGQCGVSGSGEGFFQELARYLAEALGMDFVCIDRLEDDLLSAETLAVFHNGQFEDNVSYTLRDTPCGDVVGKRICCFPRDVRGLFPRDAVLQDLQAESYLGTTLWSAQGKPIGLIAVIGRQPLASTRRAESILQLAAVRAAGELERQQAEQALRESEQLYRAIGESIDYGVWVCEPDGRNIYASESFLKLVGITQEQCSNFGWGDVLHPDDAERTIAAWKECVRTGGTWDIEHRFRGVDGNWHPILARGVPVRNEQGQITCWAGINLDIGGLKRAEQALAAAKEAAEAANNAKSRFLANISHELRTPMNAILGMIDLALPKQVDPTAKDLLTTAKGSADLLLALLNDLLDSAKIEARKLELESAPFSLRRVLDQTTQVLAVRASEKGVSFSCRVAPDVPDALVADQVRLRQILLNLGGNGIKFTEKGEVTISVRVEEGLGTGDWGLEEGKQPTTSDSRHLIPNPQSLIPSVSLEFAVRDTGIGIPQADLEHIFQPFAQADASTNRRFGGNGLGLSICSSLVAMMRGRIWVESEAGKGSTFYFTVRLPLAKELPAEPETREFPAAATSRLRILLVEDNPANQKLAAYILEDRGHTVDVAGDGQQAMALAPENHYDAILMDVQMPGMDGLEATKAIRAWEADRGEGDSPRFRDSFRQMGTVPVSARRVPIIAMTAHAMKGDRERCLAAGMDGYLSKPINAYEMIALVESLAGVPLRAPQVNDGATGPAARPGPTGDVLNLEEALSRCFDNPEILQQMEECFLCDVASLFPQMRAALEDGDLALVGRLGHRMKGNVFYLGAKRAKEAAERVEWFAHNTGHPAEAAAAVSGLERECAALKEALMDHTGLIALQSPLTSNATHASQTATVAPTPGETSPPADVAIFNLEEATRLCYRRKDMFHRMVDALFREVDEVIPQMRAALGRGDFVEVGKLGHRLKGTVVYLGAKRTMDAALSLEECVKRPGQPAEVEQAVNALRQQCEVLKAAVAAYRLAASPPPAG